MECRNGEDVLCLKDINLAYGELQVLNNLDLTLKSGEIHAILGEHGAGKSSIAKTVSGYISPHGGSIRMGEKEYPSLSLRTARNLKIRMVYQDFSLNRYFTVAENLYYADKRLPFFSWRSGSLLIEKARRYTTGHGFEIDVNQKTRTLNLSDRTVVEILANIIDPPSILILDESLGKISTAALPKILDIIRNLKNKGCTILIITHKVDSIYNLADRITIIRNGQNIYTDEVHQVDKIQLIKMAYTQIIDVDENRDQYTAFYELIKYNEAILINLPINLVIIDTYKSIRLLNNFCRGNFKISQHEYFGKQVAELFAGTANTLLDLINRSIISSREEQFYQLELKVNGMEGIFNLRLFPVDDDGYLIGSILLLEDITEYIDLQRKDIISDKLSSIGLLAASVAHEINNPLEIIYSYLTNMKFKFSSRELQRIIGKLQTELDYITHIVSNLQNFSGNEKIIVEETEVNYQIREIIDMLCFNMRERKITVHFEHETQDCFITINRNELKQVLLNLFKNSLEAMPNGGNIFISTSIRYSGERQNLCITCRDTGTGIAGKRNLFVPFYSTKQKSNKISGLGLSICHSIVNKYNGSINLSNVKTGGCEVTLLFPMQ